MAERSYIWAGNGGMESGDRRIRSQILQTTLRRAWILAACIMRARKMKLPEFEFTDLIFSISSHASNHGVQMEHVVEAEKEMSLLKTADIIAISNEVGMWELIIPDVLKVREVMET